MSTANQEWRISSTGVGTVTLGKPLPQALCTADLEARYFVRYFGDAQPLEGVRLDTPPLSVAIAGPFTQKVESEGAVEPDADAFRAAGQRAVRAGAPVRAILVQGKGPVTAAGIGVGAPLSALQAAYPDLKLHAVPPTLGGDECVAESAGLPQVRFLFPSCEAAKAGAPLLRIDLLP